MLKLVGRIPFKAKQKSKKFKGKYAFTDAQFIGDVIALNPHSKDVCFKVV